MKYYAYNCDNNKFTRGDNPWATGKLSDDEAKIIWDEVTEEIRPDRRKVKTSDLDTTISGKDKVIEMETHEFQTMDKKEVCKS